MLTRVLCIISRQSIWNRTNPPWGGGNMGVDFPPPQLFEKNHEFLLWAQNFFGACSCVYSAPVGIVVRPPHLSSSFSGSVKIELPQFLAVSGLFQIKRDFPYKLEPRKFFAGISPNFGALDMPHQEYVDPNFFRGQSTSLGVFVRDIRCLQRCLPTSQEVTKDGPTGPQSALRFLWKKPATKN